MRKSILFLSAVLIAALLGGCRSSQSSPAEMALEETAENYGMGVPADEGIRFDAAAEADVEMINNGDLLQEEGAVTEEAAINEIAINEPVTENTAAPGSFENTNRKLITNADLSIKTEKFEETISLLEAQVPKSGGYIEFSSQDSGEYSNNLRHASYTLRIPEDNLNSFLELLKGSGEVTSFSKNVQDVTLNYSAVESHLKALHTEEETLLKLMEKAENVSDILQIQSELTNVRSDLEFYESQKRLYDNQISYATLNISISEKGVVLSSGQTIPTVYVVMFVIALIIILFGILFLIFYLILRRKKKKTDSSPAGI